LTHDADEGRVTGLVRVLEHELGQIAALFDGYIAQLEDRAAPDDVAPLRRTTQRLRTVYEGLVELAEVASSAVSRSALDPGAAIAAARERLRAGDAPTEGDIDVRIRPLPPVVADPAQLEQLFTHLLRSAATKAPRRRPVVVTGSRDGADVLLNIGVDSPRLREGAVAGGRSLVGQGMGLAVSSQIAERNGGRLWVTRDDRSGMTISLTLPAAEP
jgi:signal transduction histidine kinase